ncbi:MAG TPA: ABC transporter permease [Planctomycetota bacterium]|nr:ABC transporter permease [Planctomycetota bacterium]
MSPLALARLAAEGLWDERRRVGLAAVGVVIGVTSIVLLISIGTGARTYVRDQFGGVGADTIVVIPGRVDTTGAIPGMVPGVPRPITIEDVRAILHGARSVASVAPVTIGTSKVQAGEKSRDCMVLGATAEFEEVRRFHAAVGRFLPPDGQATRGDRTCTLGDTVARELFRGENPLGKQVRIGGMRFRVQGVMEPKGRQQGFDLDELVFVPEPVAHKIFNLRSVSRVLVRMRDVESEDLAKAEIKAVLKKRHKGIEDFTVITPGQVLESLQRIVSVLTGALAGIAAVSLLVGGIGIANTALVATTARTEEVGIKKALGAGPGWILAQFVLESAALGAIGGLGGAGLAWLLCKIALLTLGKGLPLETPAWSIGLAIVSCGVVGLLAGALPAARAAALDPIQALRAGGGGRK